MNTFGVLGSLLLLAGPADGAPAELRTRMVRFKNEIVVVKSIQQRSQPGTQSHGFV